MILLALFTFQFMALAGFLEFDVDFMHVVCMWHIWVMLWFGTVRIGVVFCIVLCVYEWEHWLSFYTVGKEYTVLLPDRNTFASRLCRDECDWKLQVWNFKSLVSLVKLCNPLPLVTCWRLCSSALRQSTSWNASQPQFEAPRTRYSSPGISVS